VTQQLDETTTKCDEKLNELTRNNIKNSRLKLGDKTKTKILMTTEYESKKWQKRRERT